MLLISSCFDRNMCLGSWPHQDPKNTKSALYTRKVAHISAQQLSISLSGMRTVEITTRSISQHNDTILVTGIGMYQTGGISRDQYVFVRCTLTTQPLENAEGCCFTGVLQTFSWQMSSLSLVAPHLSPSLSLSRSLSHSLFLAMSLEQRRGCPSKGTPVRCTTSTGLLQWPLPKAIIPSRR